ncbi:EAL domain-containing protein [Pleurocapsales cyanobacterium LEGE 06147]|nr:EAL domain-containing protein [Pleurocapsales cyanobacterium LEGE 06147]
MNALIARSKAHPHNLVQFKKITSTYTYSVILTSVVVSVLVLGIRHLGGLQTLELLAYDWMVRLQNQDQTDDRILLVEITESDIQQQNQWPITDVVIAQLLQKLQQHHPKVIGLDLNRNIAHPPGNQILQKQLQADNVIVIETLGNVNDRQGSNFADRVLPPPNVPAERVGFNDLVLDIDDKLRRNLMYARVGERELYSFSLRLSLHYLKDHQLEFEVKPNLLRIGETIFIPLEANSGGYQMEASEAAGWQILLNYQSWHGGLSEHGLAERQRLAEALHGSAAPAKRDRITLTEVLEGKFNPQLVKDKIVLIGSTAPSLKDFFYTPYSGAETLMPGVTIHAQMVSQIVKTVLDDLPLFWFWPQWIEGIWIWGWSLIGAAIVWRLKNPLALGLATVISLGGLWQICLFWFTRAGWIPLVPPALASIITAVSVLASKIVYTAFYDSLTGLPNRSLFTKRLKQLKYRDQNTRSPLIAVLCLDLDRFKLINDGLGYQAGDRLLITTAKRLKAYCHSDKLLARVGGDEFAIALNVDDGTEAVKIANQLENELTLPFKLNGQDTFTTVSIGIASDRVDRDWHPEDLLLAAHTAMYKAKVSGKARHEVFAIAMHEQALTRLQLEADLREAIKNNEFELYYQPIVSLKTGKIAGFESLVRWISSKRGFVSPGAFISVAEETGLIIPLGQWILQQACRQMHSWHQQFTDHSSLLISVNLSSRQFSQPRLVEQVQQILKTTGLNKNSLKLEITESMVMDDVENAITLLHRLKELGLQLSIDDFGTGFSSFSYLHRFPMDALKVDRSFVTNMSKSKKNQEIVSTIVMLGHKLGMKVVAEGIETETEMKALQALGCEYGQGYFFSKPLSAGQAKKILADNPQW